MKRLKVLLNMAVNVHFG